jgi:hypothetical protein
MRLANKSSWIKKYVADTNNLSLEFNSIAMNYFIKDKVLLMPKKVVSLKQPFQ